VKWKYKAVRVFHPTEGRAPLVFGYEKYNCPHQEKMILFRFQGPVSFCDKSTGGRIAFACGNSTSTFQEKEKSFLVKYRDSTGSIWRSIQHGRMLLAQLKKRSF